MTLRQSISKVVVGLCMGGVVVAGLSLAGCSETVPATSPEIRAVQHEAAEKGVDQSAKSKSGKSKGPSISPKTVKGLIKKNAQP